MDFTRRPRLALLPKPEDGLRALVAHAPRAEAFAERLAERLRPVAARFYHHRRRLATVAVFAITAWLFLHVTFGANGMVVYRQKRDELRQVQGEVNLLRHENERYLEQINALKTDPKAIEKEAREQLHYARPGEVVYVAPAEPAREPPASRSARK
jgi:cell division protein FtsB